MSSITLNSGDTVYIANIDAAVKYQINSRIGTWTAVDFPATINNTGSSVAFVVIASMLNLSDTTNYFILDSSGSSGNITFLGQDNTINISANNYGGLIRNGTNNDHGNSNVTITNIHINATDVS